MTDGLEAAYARAAEALAAAPALVVTTHENPDGDAIGSLLAAVAALRVLGKDVVAYVSGEAAFPREYRWLGLDGIVRGPAGDGAGRTLLALDCGSAERIGDDGSLVASAAGVVNVDHHHDNTRFGDVVVLDAEAPCTTYMLGRLLGLLGVPVSGAVAEALFVGLVTDTGRFAYSNTSSEALRFGAELVAAGVRPDVVFREIYENVPLARTRLLGRALDRLESRLEGRLLVASLARGDFEAAGADDTDADGIIDHLRAVEGVAVAALARELPGPRGSYKVSLRSSSPEVDVSRIARAGGGGGHVQAAGFTSALEPAALAAFLERELEPGG